MLASSAQQPNFRFKLPPFSLGSKHLSRKPGLAVDELLIFFKWLTCFLAV